MISFFKLIRLPNLLIVIISMVFILLFVITPLLGIEWFYGGMTVLQFILLMLATIFITIGGNLINDFFDMDADRINKPAKNMVGKKYPVATVQIMYWGFTVTGVLLGVVVSWMLNQLNYSLIFVFAAGLLWFYSERYQCMPVVGNIVVAFLSALSFGLVWIFQFFALREDPYLFAFVQSNYSLVNKMVLIYAGFAFVVSWLREVVKDIEDFEGDERYGCKTFAVAYGIIKARLFAVVIAVLGLFFSIYIQTFFYTAGFWILFGYFILIDLSFISIIIWLRQARNKSDYNKISVFIKTLMIIGIVSMILVYFEV